MCQNVKFGTNLGTKSAWLKFAACLHERMSNQEHVFGTKLVFSGACCMLMWQNVKLETSFGIKISLSWVHCMLTGWNVKCGISFGIKSICLEFTAYQQHGISNGKQVLRQNQFILSSLHVDKIECQWGISFRIKSVCLEFTACWQVSWVHYMPTGGNVKWGTSFGIKSFLSCLHCMPMGQNIKGGTSFGTKSVCHEITACLHNKMSSEKGVWGQN